MPPYLFKIQHSHFLLFGCPILALGPSLGERKLLKVDRCLLRGIVLKNLFAFISLCENDQKEEKHFSSISPFYIYLCCPHFGKIFILYLMHDIACNLSYFFSVSKWQLLYLFLLAFKSPLLFFKKKLPNFMIEQITTRPDIKSLISVY